MASYVTEAVVTGARRFAEADRLLTLLTRDRGRISAIAKSARKTKSAFSGAAEPFVHARFELAEGRSLHIVSHAEIINPHLAIRESWTKFQLAAHVAEIVNKMGEEHHPDPTLYTLTVTALNQIDESIQNAVIIFKAELLKHMGIFPNLSGCVGCGRKKVKGRVHLDMKQGGFLCSECALESQLHHPVPLEALHILYQIHQEGRTPPVLEDQLWESLDEILTCFLQAFIQAEFQTSRAAREAWIQELRQRKALHKEKGN